MASLSRRDHKGDIIGTGKWTPDQIERGYKRLAWALQGVGNPERERLFRMNVTLCLHRAATKEEIAGLPPFWHGDDSGMAGGPVALIWSKGIDCAPSCMPCENPEQIIVIDDRPDLWIPGDCGNCSPCIARATIAAEVGT